MASPAGCMPPELKEEVLDLLPAPDLVSIARVSSDWRTLAIAHENYCHQLKLELVHSHVDPAGPIAHFLARILAAATAQLPLGLEFQFDEYGGPRNGCEKWQSLLDAIPTVLPFVKSLEIDSYKVANSVLDLIEHMAAPAPQLRHLSIDYGDNSASCEYCKWTAEFLGRSAPKLWSLRIGGIVPPILALPAFAQITHIEFLDSNAQNFPFAEVFPAAKSMVLYLDDFSEEIGKNISNCNRLESLDLRNAECCWPTNDKLMSFLKIFDASTTARVSLPTVVDIDDDTDKPLSALRYARAIGSLPGGTAVQLRLEEHKYESNILGSPVLRLEISTQVEQIWSRIVHTPNTSIVGDALEFSLLAPRLACVHTQLKFLALLLGQAGVLPRLRQLSIEVGSDIHFVDDWRRTGVAREPRQFPALEIVRIHHTRVRCSTGCTSNHRETHDAVLRSEELQAFAEDLNLGAVSAELRPRLQLHGVRLDESEDKRFNHPLRFFKF